VKRKLEFVTKKKEKEKEDYHFVSISHFVSLYKNRGKHEKKDMKKGKRISPGMPSLEFCFFLFFSTKLGG